MSAAVRPLRVLVIAGGEPWPLDHGGRLHLFHVLRQLCTRAEVTLAVPTRFQHAAHLPADLRRVEIRTEGASRFVPDDAVGRPTWIERRAARHFGLRPEIAAYMCEATAGGVFDVAMLCGAVLGQYARYCRCPVVWNPQDELVLATFRERRAQPWVRWPALLRRAALYAAYERAVQRRVTASVYVSPIDAAWARRWAPRAEIVSIPNGVDGDYFHPEGRAPVPGRVVFVGALNFAPNVDAACWLAERVWPALHARDARRTLHIVGRAPLPRVRALARRPGVVVRADVPDVRPELAAAAVVAVPLRTGGGIKNKILEAAAMRRPIVASPIALGGLSARPGLDLLVAEGAYEWTAQLERLLSDPHDAEVLATRGRAWVVAAHDWTRTGELFHDVLALAAGRRPAAQAARDSAPIEVPGAALPAEVDEAREAACH